MKIERVVTNKIQCAHCKDIIESEHRHDFRWCKCGKVAVDGGKEYRRRVGDLDAIIEMSEVYEEDYELSWEREDHDNKN